MTTPNASQGSGWRRVVPRAEQERYRSAGWWRDVTTLDEFLMAARSHPHKAAVVAYSVGSPVPSTVTYGQLSAMVDRIACTLLDLGIERGDVVTIQLPNIWQFPAIVLGAMRAGAIPNPVPPIYRQHELGFMLNHARSKLYVIQSEFRGFSHDEMAANLAVESPHLRHVVSIGSSTHGALDFDETFLTVPRELEPGARERLEALRPAPDDPAFLMFTSGTTGQPKAALHSFNTSWSAGRGISEAIEAGPDDVCFMASTVGHLTGFFWGTLVPLSLGQKTVYQDVWDVQTLLGIADYEGITWTVSATPFVMDMVEAQKVKPRSLATWRAFVCGGAPIPPTAAVAAKEHLGIELISLWGMTEVGVIVIHHVGTPVETLAASDGMPVDFMELRIVDADLQLVCDGVEGRLQVRGPSIILGYYDQPEHTTAAQTQDGWFETGDLGKRTPDGGLRITGRSKDIIVRGGQNVPVVEIENALAPHSGVEELVIVAYPDTRLGERGCAVVVPRPDATPTLEDIKVHLADAGVAKQFWPERLEVVDAMPRTPAGKIQKYILRQWVAQRLAESTSETTAQQA
jgi:cyclohexanecarboxylate-CoA ligase